MDGDLKSSRPAQERCNASKLPEIFEAVVDAVATADGGEAVEDMGQVLGRILSTVNFATIDPHST